jgi:hypothetical protein
MAKKELHQLYGGRKPKSYRPAHNHVTARTGSGGFGYRRNGSAGDGLSVSADGVRIVGATLTTHGRSP